MPLDKKLIELNERERLYLGHCMEEWFRQCGTSDQDQWQKDLYKKMTGEEPTDWWKKTLTQQAEEAEKIKGTGVPVFCRCCRRITETFKGACTICKGGKVYQDA